MKNPWPIGIAAVLVVFATGMALFVRAALRQPDALVRADYYAHELAYSQQIERERGAGRIPAGELASFVPGTGLVVALPAGAAAGRIEFYRPSDAALDRAEAYAPGADGRHVVAETSLQPGFWRVRLTWEQGGRPCFKETAFRVGP